MQPLSGLQPVTEVAALVCPNCCISFSCNSCALCQPAQSCCAPTAVSHLPVTRVPFFNQPKAVCPNCCISFTCNSCAICQPAQSTCRKRKFSRGHYYRYTREQLIKYNAGEGKRSVGGRWGKCGTLGLLCLVKVSQGSRVSFVTYC